MNQDDTIEALKDNELGITALPFWYKERGLSKYEKSEHPFDIEWGQAVYRFRQLENEYLPTLVGKQHKAETVCVYFRNDKPYYVHRRSTKYREYEWLIKANRFNVEGYERRLLTYRGRQCRLDKEQQKASEEAKKKAELNKLRNEALDKAYKLERERLWKNAHDNWEREKAEMKKYIDSCMYQANAWLHGHTAESFRNQEAWRLAEKEEEEETINN